MGGAFLIWGACLVLTLHRLQIVRVDDMRARARKQQECVVSVQPRRGKILDRAGRPLAVSTEAYTLYVSSAEVRGRPEALSVLSRATGIQQAKLSRKLSRDGFVLVARRLAPDVADAIRLAKIEGVELVAEARRFYPRGSLAAHVLGFVVPDNDGIREGLEQRYDREICGAPGAWMTLHDATGRHIRMEERQAPAPGNDLVTSIDEVIQHLAERELAAAVARTGAKAGTVVVLHTPTGEVLALANHPTFNPNQYGRAEPAARRNRAVVDYYEPGSTFKMVTAAAAIEEGLVRSSEAIDCGNGMVRVSGIPIRDHKSFGVLSFREAIEESSNGCAMKVGLRLVPAVFHDYISRFGFGSPTGIDLPGETRGRLRPVKQWSGTSQAYLSFGQEIGVNAVQVAAAYSAIANRGVHVAPRLVKRILDPRGRSVSLPERPATRRVIGAATADVLVDLMESTVQEGTGKAAAVPGYRVAGKTGTAQKIVDGRYSLSEHVSSFCGFVPAREPVLTIHVVLDDPKGALFHGGDVAAPVFARIAAPALDYLAVPREPEWNPFETDVLLASSGADGGERPFDRGRDPRRRPGERRAEDRGKGGRRGEAVESVEPRPFELELPEEDAAAGGMDTPATIVVPDLAGAPLRDAVVGLARMKLRATIEGEGFVVSQTPPPGAELEPGVTVSLSLARRVRREADGPRASGSGRGGGS